MAIEKYSKVKKELDKISPSYCVAKWKQVTIHLQNGQTHSCHHPGTHKIPLEELKENVTALHNTNTKKKLRKEMLEGERPLECDYCWKIEDANPDNISDRVIKSADDWAYSELQELARLPWDADINPSYMEVSFGNECNFRCAYCFPHISSSIMAEQLKYGPSQLFPNHTIEILKEKGHFPYSKDQHNPYVEAFWEWWPKLRNDLNVFRITGGEPLLNPNTFRFLDAIIENPLPELNLAINSNLGIPKNAYDLFLKKINHIVSHKLVKSFQLYTSVDTHGPNAEYIRYGLNYNEYLDNVRRFLSTVPESQLIFMSTYNALSVFNFDKFLLDVLQLKKDFFHNHQTRVILDTPYLRDPQFLSCYVLTKDYSRFMDRDLAFMKEKNSENNLFFDYEIAKFERIKNWFESLEESEHRNGTRRGFYAFVHEYGKRKNIVFKDYCPEYVPFLEYCKQLMFSV